MNHSVFHGMSCQGWTLPLLVQGRLQILSDPPKWTSDMFLSTPNRKITPFFVTKNCWRARQDPPLWSLIMFFWSFRLLDLQGNPFNGNDFWWRCLVRENSVNFPKEAAFQGGWRLKYMNGGGRKCYTLPETNMTTPLEKWGKTLWKFGDS